MSFKDGFDEEYAAGWKPEIGDEVEGIVEGISYRDGGYGEYPILTIVVVENDELTTERLALHLSTTVLKSWMQEKGVTRGDGVALRYNGRKANKAGTNEFHDYSKSHVPEREVPAHLRLTASVAAPVSSLKGGSDEPW
jgi:hypothetical protein